VILAYHGLDDQVEDKYRWVVYGTRRYDLRELRVNPDMFEQQMGFLHRRGYQTTGLAEILGIYKEQEKSFPKRFVLTFDDGYRDVFTLARPILKRLGYTATVFLVTDKINESHQNQQFLSWEEVLQLQKEGFSFGAHSCSHSSLTSLSLREAEYEIQESKNIIEAKLNSRVGFFAYPYGDFNPEIQNLVKKAGFSGAVITPQGPGVENGPFSLKRVGINRQNSMGAFRLKVNGVFSWVRESSMLWPILMKIKGNRS
jgi:peptidoglycan/xylan/chitin deacetylase (PgdA/CDA1 family)